MQENAFQPGQHGINDDATIGVDVDGRVLSASSSAATALGYSRPEELQGVSLAELVGDEDAHRLLDRIAAPGDARGLYHVYAGENAASAQDRIITFIRHDGSRTTLNSVVTPGMNGSRITSIDPASGGVANAEPLAGFSAPMDVAGILRRLAEQSGSIGDVSEITSRFATELVNAVSADSITVARSSAISGIYEPLARVSQPGGFSLTETIDLPPALIPQQGSGPIAVESLETLALFEPVIIYGEEFDGAYIAARADLHDGAHLLVIATAPGGKVWHESATLLLESGVLALAGTLRAAELDRRIASYSRASETVRQIGALASRDHNGGFLDAARKIIARRLPVSAISIHVADPVTGLCYVPEASSPGDEENGALAPDVEWQLAGSIEQRVLKTGAAVFTSAASSERLSVPPATIAHWRKSGLQAVAAIPLREAGEIVAIMLAGFSSPVSDYKEMIRLLESIAPAVHLGVGLSAGRPGADPEPEDSTDEAGFVSPKVLLAIAQDASESPDTLTLFASVTEWMREIIPCDRVAWGTIDRSTNTYHRAYRYDTTATVNSGDFTAQLTTEELGVIDIAGLGMAEPGLPQELDGSMRAAVTAGNRVLGVVTVWPRDDESFTSVNLARLERTCKMISGPLDRVLETEAVRKSLRKREEITQIGVLAAEFSDPAQAMRALRANICKIFPHDRALFIEIDQFDGIATVRYDSATLPNEPESPVISLSNLPSPDFAAADEPVSVSVSGGNDEPHPVFAGYESLLAIPIRANVGPECALLLLSETAKPANGEQVQLARSFSDQLKGALAGWHAYASTRDLRHDVNDIRKQLSLVLDSAPIALISVDANGVCLALEGHGLETLGIIREEMHGSPVFKITEDSPQLEDAIRQALRGELATALTPFGAYSVEVWAQPKTEIDGTVTGATLVWFDVSDRLRSNQANAEKRELQATLAERTDIIETASHDLRQQLQAIMINTELLSYDPQEKLSQGEAQALTVIQRSAEKLDKMIEDLPGLDYELIVSRVDVSNLMREIVEAQEQIFVAAGQTLSLSVPEQPYTVLADNLRVTQVVTNLLSNASKYSPSGAFVSIEVSVREDQLVICVIDTGPGIPSDQLERVWDTHIRLPSSDTKAVKGSGLGLAIARRFVEMHGGTASIESEVGFGTTVTVTLPGAMPAEQVVDETGDTAAKSASKSAASGTGTRRTRASSPIRVTRAKPRAGAAPRKRRPRTA